MEAVLAAENFRSSDPALSVMAASPRVVGSLHWHVLLFETAICVIATSALAQHSDTSPYFITQSSAPVGRFTQPTNVQANVAMNANTPLLAIGEFIAVCDEIDTGEWTNDTSPLYGTASSDIVYGPYDNNGTCPGQSFPRAAEEYLWTNPSYIGMMDKFKATYTTKDGIFNVPVNFTVTLVGLAILTPAKNSSYELTQGNYNTTTQVPYVANAGDQKSPINWNTTLVYSTSGHKGNFKYTQSFLTTSGTTQNEQYSSMGGQLTAVATQGGYTDNTVITVTGAPIPTNTITSELMSLYSGGTTPQLLQQISEMESGEQQFTTQTLYKVSALWPDSSTQDGGSHIGLLQVPTSMGFGVAFDWTMNAQAGASIFLGDIPLATTYENRLVKANPGLPSPTGCMIENDALSIYRIGTKYNYYTVVEDNKGNPQWAENTAGDPTGAAYADSVRQQSPASSCAL